MPYTTTTELRDRLAQEVGDTSPSSTVQTRYVNLLDEAHKKILAGGGELNLDKSGRQKARPYLFSWALEQHPIVFNTELAVTEGTVSVTKGSTSITFSSAPAASVEGWYIQITGTQKVYRITAHTAAATAATLDGAYTDTTSASAAFKCVKLDYVIGNGSTNKILVPTDYIRCYFTPYKISIVDHPELLTRFPLSLLYEGYPTLASIKKTYNGQIYLTLPTHTTEIERLELPFVKVPTTLDTSGNNPVIPEEDRDILVYFAAFYAMRKTDDTRADAYFAMAQARFEAMKTKDMQFMTALDNNFGYVSSLYSDKHMDYNSGSVLTEHQLKGLSE